MRKIKTVLVVCIVAAMMLGLTACGGREDQETLPTIEPSSVPEHEEPSSQNQENESAGQRTETPAPEVIALTGPAAELMDNIVVGWSLGNTLDSYSGTELGKNVGLNSEMAWGNPKTSQELIDLVKDSGINAVRVPVTWFNHMDDNYVIDEAWMDRVQEIVDYVINDDMYCLLNVHHDTGSDGWLRASDTNLDEDKAMFTAIWKQICERFGDYDEHLMFEGFNELLNDNNEWVNPDSRAVEITNELNQLFVDTVRASGGNNAERILVVNTYCAGGNSSVTKGFVLPIDTVDNSLVVSAHIYQPFNFTAQEYPNATTWDKASVDSYLKNMYTSFVQKGIPVIIGEFGSVDKNNTEQRLSWIKYYVETCREYGIKCFWWDNGDAYRLINRRSLQVAHKDLLGMLVATAKGEEYIPQGEDEGEATDNLCANVDNWSGWVNSSAKATISYLPNGTSVEVTDGGDEEWYIQPTYTHITLEQGVSYELSFDYVATKNVTIAFHFQQNYDPYGVYASGSIDCTQEVQHYSAVITMEEKTDGNVALVYNCGKHGESVPYTLTVTNLSLVKVEE
ncbi:MAG: cellulase family glycosylhydrolase [Acetatifactor sp.]|nr:cellulase family glycosylhydrolase [Acetatifactor sp.]